MNKNTIIAADRLSGGTAKRLSDFLSPALGFRLPVRTDVNTRNASVISLDILPDRNDLGDEGYELSVRRQSIRIAARNPAGQFYACQTLRQMLPKEILCPKKAVLSAWRIPCAEIRDYPRFSWRGLMLDPARYFQTPEFIRRYIDLLSFYKMNRLHLHLNDTQAWTLEIKKYPRLTVTATRWPAGEKERGTYSQSEMREIVKYAAARQVMVIPEFDLPCHARAILNAYPALICSHIPRPTGSHDYGEMCAGKEEVYDFIGNVLDELISVFDSPYIHIGGDEYGGWHWDQCPDCAKRLKAEHLEKEDTSELRRLFKKCQGSPRKYLLYRYMMRRVAGMVVAGGRIPILWDDMAWRGQFPDKSVIMQWHCRGAFDWMQNADTPENPAQEAAEAGRGAIVAATSHYYFNYLHGGALLRRLYEFEPVPPGLSAATKSFILGPHACCWDKRQAEVDGKLFPRLLALAERGWTANTMCRWNDFRQRLDKHLPRLEIIGIRFSRPNPWPLNKLTCKWQAPANAKREACWFINEIIAGNCCCEARVRICRGQVKKTILRLSLVKNGREIARYLSVPAGGLKPGERLFRFRITGFDRNALYQARLGLEGSGKPACRGEIVFRRLRRGNIKSGHPVRLLSRFEV